MCPVSLKNNNKKHYYIFVLCFIFVLFWIKFCTSFIVLFRLFYFPIFFSNEGPPPYPSSFYLKIFFLCVSLMSPIFPKKQTKQKLFLLSVFVETVFLTLFFYAFYFFTLFYKKNISLFSFSFVVSIFFLFIFLFS